MLKNNCVIVPTTFNLPKSTLYVKDPSESSIRNRFKLKIKKKKIHAYFKIIHFSLRSECKM